MKTYSRWAVCLLVVCLFACVGCPGQGKRLNAPPQGYHENHSQLHEYYTYMVDNAMCYDMCLAEIHFVPHTARLNSLGLRRLQRYTELLKDDGGTIHLESPAPDAELTEQRVQKVSDFLATAGPDAAKVIVKVGLPRGRPLDANDAIRIKQEGTVSDYESGGTSSSSGGGS